MATERAMGRDIELARQEGAEWLERERRAGRLPSELPLSTVALFVDLITRAAERQEAFERYRRARTSRSATPPESSGVI